MMAFYPVPQLQQLVAAPALRLYGYERLNKGHMGPTCTSYRNSDANQLDIYTTSQIDTHLAASSGVPTGVRDQVSGNSTYQMSPSNFGTAAPKLSNGGVIQKTGQVTMATFDGSEDQLFVNGALGIGSGAPAITAACFTGDYTGTAGITWAFGPDTGGGNPDMFYARHTATTTTNIATRGPQQQFTGLPVNMSGNPQYQVVTIAAGANLNTTVLRQNGVNVTNAVPASGTMALSDTAFTWCGRFLQSQVATMKSSFLGVWNAALTGEDLLHLEKWLEGMRLRALL
jgi:hypothetical protein